MGQQQEPVGVPFSRLYLRSETLDDSPRFRVRLGSHVIQLVHGNYPITPESELAQSFRLNGLIVPSGRSSYEWLGYFQTCPLPDALDAITFLYQHLKSRARLHNHPRAHSEWLYIVRQIITEEGLAYRIDDECGVHPLVDAGFEIQRVSVLEGLGAARYNATRTYFESALAALEERPPDTRAAVKHAFDAAEQVFMMFADKNTGLAADTVRSHLRPAVNAHYRSSDESQQLAASHMLSSFEQWVHAGHKYRHANKDTEPHEPSAEFAIAYISAAMGHLRWLAAIDQARLQPASA